MQPALQAWWRGKWGKLIVAVAAALYAFSYVESARDWHFIDNLDLLIHEAGHWVFLPFGQFMHVLGGSLFQIIFPLIYVAYFYFRRDLYSASILLLWPGFNLLNVSIYAGDAVAMQLPLLGGDASTHDWHYLLSSLHMLPYTAQVSGAIYATGILCIAAAVVGSIYYSQQN
jgi:hypothetical protein